MAEKEIKGIKKFFEEFKAFAMRGNVLDMAVGVVVGSAFTAIVNSLVGDIISPLIGLFFNADFSDVVIQIGDVGIGEITPNDLFEFRDAIAVLPKSMPRVHRMMEFVDIHALYADRSGVDRISPQSIKKYLGAVQALLGFAFQERFIPANTGAGIKVEGYTKKSTRRPFTQDELAQLFAADLFVAPWSKPTNK